MSALTQTSSRFRRRPSSSSFGRNNSRFDQQREPFESYDDHMGAQHTLNPKTNRMALFKDNIVNASGRNRALAVGGVVLFFMIICGLYWKFSGNSKTIDEGDEYDEEYGEKQRLIHKKKRRRVRFEDEQGGSYNLDSDDEEEEKDAETLARERQMAQTAHIQQLVGVLSGIKTEINTNTGEIEEVQDKIQEMVGESKESYDDEQSAMENEQSLATAFLMKDDIDKQRNGRAQLKQELELNKVHLMKRYNEQLNMVKHYGGLYREQYGTDPPINFTPPEQLDGR